MKKFFVFCLLNISLLACNTQPAFIDYSITGKIRNLDAGQVILNNTVLGHPVSDTVNVVKGKFIYTGSVAKPGIYYLTVAGKKGRLPFFLCNEPVKVEASIDDDEIVGQVYSSNNDLKNSFDREGDSIVKNCGILDLRAEFARVDKLTAGRRAFLDSVYEVYSRQTDSLTRSFIETNIATPIGVFMLSRNMDHFDLEKIKELIAAAKSNKLMAPDANLSAVEKIYTTKVNMQPGCVIEDISLPDTTGKIISLSSVYSRNKLTLVDFWAAWCMPCRRFNPFLVKIYKKYHRKGFEIYAISFDRERSEWTKAIKKDGLSWPQVSDLKYWEAAASDQYYIKFIPQNILVDGEGVIVGRCLDEQSLVEILDAL